MTKIESFGDWHFRKREEVTEKIVTNIYYGYDDDGTPILDLDETRRDFEASLKLLEENLLLKGENYIK